MQCQVLLISLCSHVTHVLSCYFLKFISFPIKGQFRNFANFYNQFLCSYCWVLCVFWKQFITRPSLDECSTLFCSLCLFPTASCFTYASVPTSLFLPFDCLGCCIQAHSMSNPSSRVSPMLFLFHTLSGIVFARHVFASLVHLCSFCQIQFSTEVCFEVLHSVP